MDGPQLCSHASAVQLAPAGYGDFPGLARELWLSEGHRLDEGQDLALMGPHDLEAFLTIPSTGKAVLGELYLLGICYLLGLLVAG